MVIEERRHTNRPHRCISQYRLRWEGESLGHLHVSLAIYCIWDHVIYDFGCTGVDEPVAVQWYNDSISSLSVGLSLRTL